MEAASGALFGRGSLAELPLSTLSAALGEAGAVTLDRGPVPAIVDLLVASGLCDSKSAARRAIGEGGAYLNNERVSDESYVPGDSDFVHGKWLVLRRGRRTFAGVERA